ncbi:glycerophosphodiester phosphodiesterase [Chromohalobacter sp. TMW 2.2308]|uniref:glycerophosphodiester phosphodiesterase n=1 Tax=Chromohalobacter TaxID=42054 RepID=UPI001FFC3571|nr:MULTISPECIES: glycerophosphodiester phosphodiesterase [Chromohalobacter]MCK2043173.1 glycerophosphodiester phosphodiesterase [Chromohalobacter moromii]MCT8515590.1 glycerophosphodiester phosphodiesterase [Chromohalobacter sp. TMW 2.2271]
MSTLRPALVSMLALLGSTTLLASMTAQADALEQQRQALHNNVQVIAHRGASGYAPEHTWYAYDKALAMGTDYLELDVHMSADGHLVAIHDTTLERTTDGQGPVKEHSLDELKALDAGSWFNQAHPEYADDAYAGAKLLTLDDVIDRYGQDVRYYIETKSPQDYPELQDALVSKLEAEGLVQSGSVVIQSFSQTSLQEIHDLNPDIPLIQLLWYSPGEDGKTLEEWTGVTPSPANITDADFQAIANYADGVGPNYLYEGEPVIDARFIEQAHANDLLVHVYTINDKDRMRRLLGWGVDGLFTNFPDQLKDVLAEAE